MKHIVWSSRSILKPKLKNWAKLKIKNNKRMMLYPEGRVVLNDTAYDILKLCDGTRNICEITKQMEKEYNAVASISEVQEFIDFAKEQMWID